MVHVGVIGDAFVDVLCRGDKLPFWGGDVLLNGVAIKPGGSASNTASHLAGLLGCLDDTGHSVSFHTALGSDAFGDILVNHHKACGCVLTGPRLPSPVDTGVCVVLSGSNDRAFMTSEGAMNLLSREHLNMDSLKTAQHIHIGGYYSISKLQKSLGSIVKELRVHTPSLTVSLDTNYDASENWASCEGFLELLAQVDVFLPNETEAMGISGQEDLSLAAKWLASRVRAGGAVVMTCGKDGVLCAENGSEETPWSVPAPSIEVVDATGAGDAFNAAFLMKWAVEKKSLRESAAFGIFGGSTAVQYHGACDTLLSVALLSKFVTA